MDVGKLESLATELERSAQSEDIILRDLPDSDPSKQDRIVHWKNLQRWAQTIREAIK
jgi:hypothetical protein